MTHTGSNIAEADTHIGLKTDKYELTMLEAFIKSGMHNRKAVFELFGRKLPQGRNYGVVAGTARAIDAILNFKFSDTDLTYLAESLAPETIDYLRNYSFTGEVMGYDEGDYWFPYSPILTIKATLGEAVILETLLLSIFNYDSAVASAASHMRVIAGDAHLMEFGARRVNEDAAVAASRAAYIAGFDATSNLEAGRRYGVPVYGTSAHAFTLAFPTEVEAFTAQVEAFGTKTTLLVDTYDIEEGVANAIAVAGTELGAVRIDSGDPLVVIPAVRKQLNELGAVNTKIVLSGDLDAETLTTIKEAKLPIDSMGIGTSLVTGSGHPAAGLVYKLVSIENADGEMVSVAKKSAGGKKSVGGFKLAYREFNAVNEIIAERFYTEDSKELVPSGLDEVQTTFIKRGVQLNALDIEDARDLHASNLAHNQVSATVVSTVNDEEVWAK